MSGAAAPPPHPPRPPAWDPDDDGDYVTLGTPLEDASWATGSEVVLAGGGGGGGGRGGAQNQQQPRLHGAFTGG